MNLAISTFFSLTSGRLNTSKIHRFLAKRGPLGKTLEASESRERRGGEPGRQASSQSGVSGLSLGPTSDSDTMSFFLDKMVPARLLPR